MTPTPRRSSSTLRAALARATSIPVELTANGTGRVQLTLTRGTRTLARASIKLDADGTADHRLKLPKGIKAGRYTLTANYGAVAGLAQPDADGQGVGQARERELDPRRRAGVRPRALPDGRFHGARPERTFEVTTSAR